MWRLKSFIARLLREGQTRRRFSDFRSYVNSKRSLPWLVVDLDNTLIDTGSLLAKGLSLDEAAKIAQDLPEVVDALSNVRATRPEINVVFLSARPYHLEEITSAWISSRGILRGKDRLFLVPRAKDKIPYWKEIRKKGTLVILDDLTKGQETGKPVPYDDVVLEAKSVADLYCGYEDLCACQQSEDGKRKLVERLVNGLK